MPKITEIERKTVKKSLRLALTFQNCFDFISMTRTTSEQPSPSTYVMLLNPGNVVLDSTARNGSKRKGYSRSTVARSIDTSVKHAFCLCAPCAIAIRTQQVINVLKRFDNSYRYVFMCHVTTRKNHETFRTKFCLLNFIRFLKSFCKLYVTF